MSPMSTPPISHVHTSISHVHTSILFLLAPEQKHIKHIITHIIQRYLFMPTSSALSTKHLAPHALFMALLLAPDALCCFPIFWKYSCEWEGKPFLAWCRKALAV